MQPKGGCCRLFALHLLIDFTCRILRSLNLPASLEALERPVGLPPSFLKKAEEVRLENGPVKIEAAIEDLYRLSRQNSKLLNEVRATVKRPWI